MSGEAEYDSSDILVSAVRCCQLPVTAGVSLLWLRQSLFRVNLLRGPSYMSNLGVTLFAITFYSCDYARHG